MGIVASTMPTPGDPRGSEELDLANTVQSLLAEFNGNISLENFSTALRAAVNGVAVTKVSTLPSSPIDGQEVYYQNAAMATAGVVWRLRYNSASANANKWESVGGTPLLVEIATSESTSSLSATDLATVGPSVTAPLAGVYQLAMGASVFIQNLTGASAVRNASFGAAGAGAGIGGDIAAGASLQTSLSRETLVTLTASQLVKVQYQVTAGTAAFSSRWVSILPVRVG